MEEVGNLLRYEIQLRQPHRHFRLNDSLTVDALFKRCFAKSVVAIWLQEYFKVYKTKVPILVPEINTQKDFFHALTLLGADRMGGETALYQVIKDLQMPHTKFQAKIKGDMRRQLRKLYSNPKLVAEWDLVTELDNLVLQAALLNSF